MARPNPAIDFHGSPSFPGGATIDQDGTLELRTGLFHSIARKYIAGYREGVKGTKPVVSDVEPSTNDFVRPVQKDCGIVRPSASPSSN